MEQLTVMRTMLLLSATRRKLNLEEPLTDSGSPLKALQLSQVAVRLNDRLHAEDTTQRWAPTYSNTSRAFRSPLYESMIAESDEEDDLEDGAWDEGLAQMHSAFEVGTGLPEIHDEVVELLDMDTQDTKLRPEQRMSVDFEDYDMEEEDVDDMPVLSRQTSRSFGESSASLEDDSESESEADMQQSELAEDVDAQLALAESRPELEDTKEEVERCKEAFYQTCKASIFHLSAHGEQQYQRATLQVTPHMAAAVA